MAESFPRRNITNAAAGNFLGAFSDGAVLIPIVVALSMGSGFSGGMLLATAGLAYLAAGFVFRVPMPVQPLKSVAVAAVAIGATLSEVRVAGAAVGLCCLLLAFRKINELAARVPRPLIHGLQLGLGVILVLKGWESLGASGDGYTVGLLALAVVVIVGVSQWLRFPLLGLVATGGLLWSLIFGNPEAAVSAMPDLALDWRSIRWDLVAGLLLPQIILTLGNSVVGTCDVAERYFGPAKAARVTARRLLLSIGIGNLLSATVAGLPFCHGSGGLTAHVKGGATHWGSNFVIGIFLLMLAGLQFLGGGVALAYPALLLSALLISVGVFHMQLAKQSWNNGQKARLLLMGAVAVLTRNMLYVLIGGMFWELLTWLWNHKKSGDLGIDMSGEGRAR